MCFLLGIVDKGRPFMHFSIEAFFVKKPFLNTSAIFNFWFTVFCFIFLFTVEVLGNFEFWVIVILLEIFFHGRWLVSLPEQMML